MKKETKKSRNMMAADSFYRKLDRGIRFAVKVLHAHMIETGQSCQGGNGHSYRQPTIDLAKGVPDTAIFAAFHILSQYGLPIESISLVWDIDPNHKVPGECIPRINFWKSMEDRANENPMFVFNY